MSSSCVFCKILTKEIPSEIVFESDKFIAIQDVRPVREGHTLVIPKKHMVTLLDMPDAWGSELVRVIKKVAHVLFDKKLGDGFNIVMNNLEVAGQVVMHAHVHVIPRSEGDGIQIVK